MPRVKRGFKARQRRNKVLKLAKGYRGARSKLFRSATEAVDRALNYAFRDRRVKKRDLTTALWHELKTDDALHEWFVPLFEPLNNFL